MQLVNFERGSKALGTYFTLDTINVLKVLVNRARGVLCIICWGELCYSYLINYGYPNLYGN
jgi:hypothetical protein